MNDKYREVGYDIWRVGFGPRPAILVVDLHLAFTDPAYPLGGLPMVEKATQKTAELLKLARSRRVPGRQMLHGLWGRSRYAALENCGRT